MKRMKGYLTVFVTLSLTVLLSLFLAVLGSVRQSTVSLEAEIITDTGLNSILAEYHRELFKQYNVFFLDTSYGTAGASVGEVENHLTDYISKNCSAGTDGAGSLLYRDFLGLRAGDVYLLKTAVSSDFEGGIFRERAVEAVKDDIGLTYIQEIMSWFGSIEEKGLGDGDLAQEKQSVDEEIASYDGCSRMVDEDWVTVEVENPTKPLEIQTEKGILHLVLEEPSDLSAAGVDISGLISSRRKQGKINRGNWKSEEGSFSQDTLMDRIMFHEYIMRYCGNFRKPLSKGLLRYQIEYVISGKGSDIDNLKSVVYKLSALREASNLLYLLSDPVKNLQADEAALLAASAMLLPEIAPLLKAAILLGWAYAESLYDVKCLLAGGRIPLFKTEESWHYDISCVLEGVLEGGSDSGNEDNTAGLAYEEYLRLLLLLSPLDTSTFRMMDIMEMDIRQTEGNQSFRMDACIDRLEVQVAIAGIYGNSVEVKRRAAY